VNRDMTHSSHFNSLCDDSKTNISNVRRRSQRGGGQHTRLGRGRQIGHCRRGHVLREGRDVVEVPRAVDFGPYFGKAVREATSRIEEDRMSNVCKSTLLIHH